MNQHSKIKLYRTLKVVFYCLGLPLFFLCVISLTGMFRGRMPFSAAPLESDMFAQIFIPMRSPSFYGIWIAMGIWAVLAIIQLTLHFAVKNRRARMITMVACVLVCMIVPVFIMDAVFTAKIDSIAASAPVGVEVKSYRNQLSYYRSFTSKDSATGKISNKTEEIIKQVEKMCDVYHIEYYGLANDGTAGNIGNNPIFFDELRIDYNMDGNIDKKDHILVRVEPTGAKWKKGEPVEGTGWLELFPKDLMAGGPSGANKKIGIDTDNDGEVDKRVDSVKKPEYFFVCRSDGEGNPTFIWYSQTKMPTMREGVYGYGSYNESGLLSDGYIFSLENTLRILEDYYIGTENTAKYASGFDDSYQYTNMVIDAKNRKTAYYNSTPELKEIYNREIYVNDNFVLTAGELDSLLSLLIPAIGGSSLFALLFEDILGDIGTQLEEGMTLQQIFDLLGGFGLDLGSIGGIINTVLGALGLGDLKILLYYKVTDPVNYPDQKYFGLGLQSSKFITEENPEGKILINLDPNFKLSVIDELLAGLGIPMSLVGTLLGLLGVDLGIDANSTITDILMNLLSGMYWYQSPVIKPDFMFYVDERLPSDNTNKGKRRKLQEAYAMLEQAQYEGSMHGSMIGSTLIGDSLGTGDYGAANGLQSLQEVQQLKTDLSYIPSMYPLLALRDMLMTFAGLVMFFTILSYVCADKEYEWETGTAKIKIKNKKRKKKKGAHDDFESANPNNGDGIILSATNAEDTALNVLENNAEEVK